VFREGRLIRRIGIKGDRSQFLYLAESAASSMRLDTGLLASFVALAITAAAGKDNVPRGVDPNGEHTC
jgi:hypothetical protein